MRRLIFSRTNHARAIVMRTGSDQETMPRYNHYVPEFVLNYFATRGTVCVFDKHTSKNFKLPTKQGMCERTFKNVYVEAVVFYWENRFPHIENLCADDGAVLLAQLGIRRPARAIPHCHPHTTDGLARPPLAQLERRTYMSDS